MQSPFLSKVREGDQNLPLDLVFAKSGFADVPSPTFVLIMLFIHGVQTPKVNSIHNECLVLGFVQYLRELIVHKIPPITEKGCRMMVTIVQNSKFLYSSMLQGGGLKWTRTTPSRPSTRSIPINDVEIMGEASVKVFISVALLNTRTANSYCLLDNHVTQAGDKPFLLSFERKIRV